jgi:curli biogenesis system outer membrane secretion channel CsgG
MSLLLLLASRVLAADVLAVAYFDAHSIRPEIEPLGRGVADMLTTDLGSAPALRVVERTRIAEVLAELDLQRSDFVDPASAQSLGKGVGATGVVVGSLTVAIGGMRIDARVVDVATGEIRATAQATGTEEQFFALEAEVARELLAGLGVAAEVRERPIPLDQIVAGSRAIDAADAALVARLRGLAAYRAVRLTREAVTSTGTTAAGNVATTVGWTVYEGGNTALTARQFAERVGDAETYEKIVRVGKSGKAAAWGLWGAGATMAMGGLGYMLSGMSDSDRLLPGVVVMSTGFVVLPFSGIPAAAVRKEGWIGNYYTVEETDRLIQEHNAALAATHGVSESDALSIEVAR